MNRRSRIATASAISNLAAEDSAVSADASDFDLGSENLKTQSPLPGAGLVESGASRGRVCGSQHHGR